jgi:hypothetical protein
MNTGIIRNALTTTLVLELEYREPSIVREIGVEATPAAESHYAGQLWEDECACLMKAVEKAGRL